VTRRGPRAGLKLIERPSGVEASLWRRFCFEREAICRELLFDRYLGLARAIARGEYRRRPAYGLERGDFEQLAYGGLLEAIDRYDPLRGAPFEAFARPRIRGAIADGLAVSSEGGAQASHRRRLELERLRSLQAAAASAGTAGQSGDFVSELADLAAALAIGIIAENVKLSQAMGSGLGAYETLAWRDLQLSVLKAIELLPDNEKAIMTHHYMEGVSFTRIAQVLGLSKGRVSQLHAAALSRVRERLKYLD
jgi:RNA polymerase sigma factor FliA